MTKKASSTVRTTRGQRHTRSEARRKLASSTKVGDFVAMESADDEQGFSFWLARVESEALVHRGRKESKNGREYVDGGLHTAVL